MDRGISNDFGRSALFGLGVASLSGLCLRWLGFSKFGLCKFGLCRFGLSGREAFAICRGVYVGKGSHRFVYLYEMRVHTKMLGT